MQHDATAGNRLAFSAAEDPSSGMLPVAVIAPLKSRPDGVISPAVRAGAVAFRLEVGDPARFAWAAYGPLFAELARAGRPLLIPVERSGDASIIGEQTGGLGIPVVLLGVHYQHLADDLLALNRYPHLSVETSALAHFGAIEQVVSCAGAERVLLGTGMPTRCPQSSINAVLLAELPAAAKAAILAGNTARILGIAAPALVEPKPYLPDRSRDVHTHLGITPWGVPMLEDGTLLGRLERYGTRGINASSVLAIMADLDRGNQQIVTSCAQTRGQAGYLVADPRDLEATREQIRRYGDQPGIVGIKIHCEYSRTPTSAPAMAALFDLLAGYGKPVKIHNAGEAWDLALLAIARAHPKLPIIIAHGGPGCPSVEGARVAAASDNVYLEFSSSAAELAIVREAARITPAERLLYGSDAPLLDPAYVLGTYADAEIPAASCARVFWDNASELFGSAA